METVCDVSTTGATSQGLNFIQPLSRCISELSVAAGVPPAVEPWRLARRDSRAKSECALNLVTGSGRQDAALYGWRDASRYTQSDHHQLGDARPLSGRRISELVEIGRAHV